MPSMYEGFLSRRADARALAAELQEAQERYDLALRVSSDGLFDWNLKTDQISFSDHWREMLGIPAAQGPADPAEWFSRVHPDDLPALQSALTAHRDGLTARLEVEYRVRHADGTWRTMFSRGIAIRCPRGQATRLAGNMIDVTGRAGTARLLQMDSDLRLALERDEFELHYQPIIHIASGRIEAFEALIRWRHPQRGMVMPADFIPFAEETGFITQIGHWVMLQACRQVSAWRNQFPEESALAVAVNLSAKQFAQPDLCEQVQAALAASDLPSRCLILEITETTVMDRTERSAQVMRRLRELGVKTHIDDFGTGYCSLAYLHDFPVDAMKIDRSFVARLESKAENAEIVRAIVALAHTLNMTVTAEGVETQGQLAHVSALGCQHIQGYLLSKPLAAPAATELLAAWSRRDQALRVSA